MGMVVRLCQVVVTGRRCSDWERSSVLTISPHSSEAL